MSICDWFTGIYTLIKSTKKKNHFLSFQLDHVYIVSMSNDAYISAYYSVQR